MSEKSKNILERSFKTFIESALTYLMAALVGVDFGSDNIQRVLIGIGISCVAAGVSAVWNGVIDPMLKDTGEDIQQLIDDDEYDEG